MSILLAVAALALAVCVGILAYVARAVVSYMSEAPATRKHPSVTFDNLRNLERRLDEFQIKIDDLTVAISEGIARVDRHEKRIRKTVTSARKLVRENGLEHAGIEAEYAELQPPDGAGIDHPLPTMPEEVDPPRTIRIPGGHLEIGAA